MRADSTAARAARLSIGVPAAVRFDRSPSPARLAELERAGVHFASRSPAISGAWLVRVTERGAQALENAPDVVRVASTGLPHAPRPDGTTALVESRVTAAEAATRALDGNTIDGKGTIIADIDTSIAIFHPAFFRADGGLHAFVDVDGDGALTPNVDGVDLDGDGAISKGEVLRRLPQVLVDDRNKATALKEFAPDRDYLYLDANGNGKRDYGAAFEEDTPGYGEPIFVADDANRDGVVAITEKLARLGTSKIKAVRDVKEYRRGSKTNPLVKYEVEIDESLGLYNSARHATLTAGVLVGGTNGFALRGVAPGADLVVSNSDDDIATAIQWGIDEGAKVLLTEVAPYAGVSLDGSSEAEALIDAANAKGILTVSPVGNLAKSEKHASLTLRAGENIVVLDTQDGQFDGAKNIILSLHHAGAARAIGMRIKQPGGTWITLDPNTNVALGGTVRARLLPNVTSRGTSERHMSVGASSPLARGLWEVALDLDAGPALSVEAYVADDKTSWAYGVRFTDSNDDRTICNPATSDATIKVGAYFFDARPEGKASSIYPRSSRGPLIRGGDGVDLVSPTEALSTATPLSGDTNVWTRYGGTSGAGPQVAGAVALLRQALPTATAADIRARLVDKARTDDVVKAAGRTVAGHGRLDVLNALGLKEPTGAPPSFSLAVRADGTGEVKLDPQLAARDAAGLKIRWDLDYDGAADTKWEPIGPRALAGLPEGPRAVRAEILDTEGQIAAATANVTIGKPTPAVVAAPAVADDSDGCAMVAARRATGRGAPLALALVAGIASVLVARRRRTPR